MRYIIALISWLLISSLSITIHAEKKPDWLTERPNGTFFYIGIGSASKSSPNYQQVAKQNAIAELVSEIEIKVEASSLMTTLEKEDESVSSYFSEIIQTSVKQHIKDFEQVDNWQDEQNYWVYYRLDKETYAEQVQKRRELAIRQGFDFWYNGENALRQGDLLTAIDLFMQGLTAIEPCVNEDLSCSYEGQTILVGNALYTSLQSVFDGIQLKPSNSEIQASAFQASRTPIILTIHKNNIPLRNLPIKGEFNSGGGSLSEIIPTDDNGETTVYLQNITSKNTNQEILFTLDIHPFTQIKNPLFNTLKRQLSANTPRCQVLVSSDSEKNIRAYIQSKQQGNEGLVRGIHNLLTNNYFDITDSQNKADVLILIQSDFSQGNIVEGDIYNMKEYFTTISIQIKNNRSGAILLNYLLEKKRTLSPANTSIANARNSAIREAMKIINRELGKQLKEVKIDTNGEIPQVNDTPPAPKRPSHVSTPPSQPVIVIHPKPTSQTPVEKPQSTVSPTLAKKKTEAELEPGIFISYNGKKDMSDRTFLRFNIENKNQEDYKLGLYNRELLIVNGNGEEMKCITVKIGPKSDSYGIQATIVPNTPTLLEVEIMKTGKIALFQLTNTNHRTIKLRNLE